MPEPPYFDELRRFARDVREIEQLPNGVDSDDIPERLRASAERMRRIRETDYPVLSVEQLATVAGMLGMRTRTNNDAA
jgi:hypothetical protein